MLGFLAIHFTNRRYKRGKHVSSAFNDCMLRVERLNVCRVGVLRSMQAVMPGRERDWMVT